MKQLYVGDDETLRRKIDEAVLAWQLEDRLTKDQILTKYLNTVYFGQGAYGIQAAARSYFAIDAKDLSLSQSALLAGLIRAPNDFDPFAHPVHARVRRNNVLRQMLDQGMITAAQKDEAVAEPIELHAFTSRERYPYPYFVDYFKQWFLSNPAFGKTREDRYQLLFTGGLRITTTIDPQFQRYAQSAVRSVLPYPGDPSGAMTVIDPRTGYVRAMVGGDDADYWDANSGDGRVNLATGGSTGPAGGLVVQAVRPGGRAGERHLAEHGVRRAVLDRHPARRRRGVARHERRAEQLRQPHLGAGDDLVGEHRVRAADRRARRADRRRRRAASPRSGARTAFVLATGPSGAARRPPIDYGRHSHHATPPFVTRSDASCDPTSSASATRSSISVPAVTRPSSVVTASASPPRSMRSSSAVIASPVRFSAAASS